MPLKRIIDRVSSKMGMDPADPSQRLTLLAFINEACAELYAKADMPGSLMEQVFKVNGDQTITLPSYVGRVRGFRELNSQIAWHVNKMRPRYNQTNWADMWRNARLKNKQALMTSVKNESKGILRVKKVEDPVVIVTLSGPIAGSNLIHETVVMDAVEKQTENCFTDYQAVKKNRQSTYDVSLYDVDNTLLTVIPNNATEAQYQIVDVSAFPWLPQNTSVINNYLECLFKRALPYLSDDADEFPAFDYDYVIVNKTLQLWAEEQEKLDVALALDGKANRTASELVQDQDRATEDMVALVENPHDQILRRVGNGPRRRQFWQRSRSSP